MLKLGKNAYKKIFEDLSNDPSYYLVVIYDLLSSNSHIAVEVTQEEKVLRVFSTSLEADMYGEQLFKKLIEDKNKGDKYSEYIVEKVSYFKLVKALNQIYRPNPEKLTEAPLKCVWCYIDGGEKMAILDVLWQQLQN